MHVYRLLINAEDSWATC